MSEADLPSPPVRTAAEGECPFNPPDHQWEEQQQGGYRCAKCGRTLTELPPAA